MSEPREASLSAWAARVVAIEGERDEARAERDALRAQLEPIEQALADSGLEREPSDEGQVWFSRDGGLSPEISEAGQTVEAILDLLSQTRAEAAMAWDSQSKALDERDAARADVDMLLEAIATFRRALNDEGGASTDALYAAANEIAAKRGGRS